MKKNNDNSPNNKFALAVTYHQKGNLEAAEKIYKEILKFDSRHFQSLGNLGYLAYNIKKYGRAKKYLLKALEIFPKFEDAHNNIGNVYRQLGEIEKSIFHYNQSIQINPNNHHAYNNLGLTLKELGKVDEAIKNYKKAIFINKNYIEAYCNLAVTHNELGKYEKTKYYYQRALKINPNNSIINYNLGILYNDLKKYDDAIHFYQKSLKINPKFSEAHYCLGNIYFNLGQIDKSIIFFNNSLKINLNFLDALNNLGISYKEIGQRQKSINCFKKIIKINPKYAKSYFNISALLINDNNITSAINCLKKALRIDPNNYDYNFALGILLEYSGSFTKAKKYFFKIDNGSKFIKSQLDSWNYIKNCQKNIPKMIGYPYDAFKIATESSLKSGLVLEFGVSFGNSIKQIAKLISTDIHGFDSFQGLPESWHNESKGTYSTKEIIPKLPKNVCIHKGLFKETIPKFLKKNNDSIRLINIDCDLYSSTNTVLNLLSNQIVPGSIIIFDEYLGNENWREDEFKSFQEAVKKYKWKYEYLAFSLLTKQVVLKIL